MTELVTRDLSTPDQVLVDDLLDAAHQLASLGLSPGSSGNVSVRTSRGVMLSATGSRMAELGVGDLALLDEDGTHRAGPRPTKEAPLHLAFYRRDPALRCVIHLHSSNAVAASCLPPYSAKSALPPITPYFVMRVGQTPLLPYAPPGSADLGTFVDDVTFPFRAALLQNHGSVCAGETVATTRDATIELDAAAEILLKLPSDRYRALTEEQAHALAVAHDSWWTPTP